MRKLLAGNNRRLRCWIKLRRLLGRLGKEGGGLHFGTFGGAGYNVIASAYLVDGFTASFSGPYPVNRTHLRILSATT